MTLTEQEQVAQQLEADAAAKELREWAEFLPHADYCGAPASIGSQVNPCRCWNQDVQRALERAATLLESLGEEAKRYRAAIDAAIAAIDAARKEWKP